MLNLTTEFIEKKVAASAVIFQRGTRLYEHGAFFCTEADQERGLFVYDVDGNYGDYTTRVELLPETVRADCDCPYPGVGCKHTVAVLLDVQDRIDTWHAQTGKAPVQTAPLEEDPYLRPDEIEAQALEDRRKRARNEDFKVTFGEMYKGEHLLETPRGRQYRVTLHDPGSGRGHCTCPDFSTNRLSTCKHLIFLAEKLKKKRGFQKSIKTERFPFVDVFWDSTLDVPRIFCEGLEVENEETRRILSDFFDQQGLFNQPSLAEFPAFLASLNGNKRIRVQDTVLQRVDRFLHTNQLRQMDSAELPDLSGFDVQLYPYQVDGVRFGLYRPAVLIGDEMGLGKTLQAIVLAILKKEMFGFSKVLVVTLASLKEQWKREIERFSGEKALVVAGTKAKRKKDYAEDGSLFKITNYEAVLRDVLVLARFKPDLVILDEAQRIKNFNTKTADAVKALPRKHALVLTGTPLENKLEDVYSIVQFLDPVLLSPLWKFAADHFMLSRDKKGKILGYRNLGLLSDKIKPIVIRRRKEEVLKELPEEVVNNYYLELSQEQAEMHAGYVSALIPILNKKFLTPMDLRRMQVLLLCMRRVCDSTYLIDRNTHISPKLKELEGILDEVVVQNGRKTVIFSEWTSMTYLIAKHLSRAGIKFVELTGKVPVKKRQLLIDEFSNNPECKVFLSTDAGGTGLNLQAADVVINFELPWNPARLNQRIGRVSRIGQRSQCVNVVNLICKQSIEEKILAGIQLKTDLFEGVFDGGADEVEFSRQKRTEMLNRLREMMGEEPEPVIPEARAQEEIPEDTPHYLNPEVLREEEEATVANDEDGAVAYDQEEPETADPETDPAPAPEPGGGNILAQQPPEKIENVLNSGMQFIGGLLEMATGKKIDSVAADEKMIRIDRDSGEVTMKFKLPGF